MHNFRLFSALLILAPWVTAALHASQKTTPTEYASWYHQLVGLQVDEAKVADVNGLSIARDAGLFHLHAGRLIATRPINGRMVALLFQGDGTFSMKPPTRVEQQQLLRFYERDSIVSAFKLLLLLFADSTWEELERKVAFSPGVVRGAQDDLKYCLKYLHDDDTEAFHEDFMYTFLHKERSGMFYAHFSDRKSRPFFFQINPLEEEEVSFSQRKTDTWGHRGERISQFHIQAEYAAGTAGNPEDKNLIRVHEYRIESHIAADLGFRATAVIVFQSLTDNLRWLPFFLYRKLDVDSLHWSSRGPAPFFRKKEGYALWVQSPQALAAQTLCTLTVFYKGEVLEKDELGWIGLRSSSLWYPRIGYRTRVNFDLLFHTPSKYTFMSSGKKVSEQVAGDKVVSRWQTIRPAHNVSFSIGSFKEVTPEKKDMAAERREGESLPDVKVYRFAYTPKGEGIANVGSEVRSDILNCLRFFQDVYGPSPVDELYASETPFFHGEAFPGLLHLSWMTYKFIDRTGGNEVFRAHEVAHQWWGVGVNFRTYHDQWISEGFAQYSGLWLMQALLNDNKKFFGALDKMRERILGVRKTLLGSGQESGPIWLGYRTQSSNTQGDYDLIVYQKGAWVLHMLRIMMIDLQTMNEDRFKNMMREFYSSYLGKSASTADFQRVVEKHMGTPMDWFFNQWVMDARIPEYSFAFTSTPTPEGKFRTVCRVRQAGVPKEFTMPVPLLIKFADGRFYRLRIRVSGEKEDYELPLLPMEPKEIVFNDLHSVLGEVKYEKWR